MRYVFLLLLLASCTAPTAYQNLSVQETKQFLDSNPDAFILNTHTPYEGKIPGTDAIIEDYGKIAAHLDQLPEDKSTPIVVTCMSGRMSAIASEQLSALGYTTVYNMVGGMKEWNKAGYELIDYSR